MREPVLTIQDLIVTFPHKQRSRRILDRVNLTLYPGEVMGLVGESGSGKSMTALSVMGLLPPAAKVRGGNVWFNGYDLLALPERDLRQIRGSHIAMMFQNPRAALNPLMRAGNQVTRVVRLHTDLPKDAAYEKALGLLQRVGIPDARTRARAYPHQLSGGMAQRVLLAMMLACEPRLLIADEPTTGLDVTIQAQVFELIKDIQTETNATLLLITHDLGVVSEVCERVAVMYAGQVMEVASVDDLFARPEHPYTQQLMSSVLRVDRPGDLDMAWVMPFTTITYDTVGCRFANRCPHAFAPCHVQRPPISEITRGHVVICHQFTAEETP